ncbi:MAG: CHAD domain-containing protein [Verrucomicrobia bacterium]|nr:CHAD domain-containing protein [Verrucomicrobiota bacterium]
MARVDSLQSPAGAHLLQTLHRQRRRYWKRLRRCRGKLSTKAVHGLRIEGRRLLVIFELLQGLAAADELKTARREMKRQLKSVARLRDTQVQLGVVKPLRRAHPALGSFYGHLGRQERALGASAAQKLEAGAGGLKQSLATIEAWFEAMVAGGGNDALCRAGLARALELNRRRVVEGEPAVWTGGEIHRARIALRELRYLAEFLQPILPSITADRLEKLHACQSLMGEIHDFEILGAQLTAHVRGHRRRRKALEPFVRDLIRRHDALAVEGRRKADVLFRARTGVLAKLDRTARGSAA